MNHYLAGVALLAKTDVFLQFEAQSYGAFLDAARATLRLYHDDFGPDVPVELSDLLLRLPVDDAFRTKHAGLVAQYDARTLGPGVITLSEVGEMKRFCDGLLMHAFTQRIRKRSAGDGNA